jgi:hypothetical protein
MSSYPNENGYCRWCVQEGVVSKEAQSRYDAHWAAILAERKRKEEEEWEQEKEDHRKWSHS